MTDECTKKKNRLRYARVCVEISFDCSFPSLVPLWIDGVHVMDLPVQYKWKPSKCIKCCSFGHNASYCSVKGVKTKAHWTSKKIQHPPKPMATENGGVLGVLNPVSKISTPVGDNIGVENENRDNDGDLDVTNSTRMLVKKIPDRVCVGKSDVDNEEVHTDSEATNAPLEIFKKKKKRSRKHKEAHSVEEIQEGIKVDVNAQHVMEGASTSSTDPSIPPGFENVNRFHVFEEEEEVATSQLAVEDSEISISKPSSSEQNLESSKKLSLKAKKTGMFPTGTLSTKKKKLQNSGIPKKISTTKLLEFGSSWGLDPPRKIDREDMFKDLVNNHDDLTIEDVEEYPT